MCFLWLGTTTYTYDTMDRLTTKATPEGTLNYTYDVAGHVASIASSNTNGASMSYTYDSINRLSTVVDNRLSGSNTTTYTYDDASNVGTVTYPNGVQSTFTYDTLNRVSGLSSQVSGYTYQRDPTGNPGTDGTFPEPSVSTVKSASVPRSRDRFRLGKDPAAFQETYSVPPAPDSQNEHIGRRRTRGDSQSSVLPI